MCRRRSGSKPTRATEVDVKASLFYRIAAVLLVLFAVAHTLGFRQSDPSWHVGPLLASMQSLHFDMLGSSRTYWDLFVAAGFTVGVFYLFAAVLAWQLGSVPAATRSSMQMAAWGFVLCFVGVYCPQLQVSLHHSGGLLVS
jgi:hypothetical protein